MVSNEMNKVMKTFTHKRFVRGLQRAKRCQAKNDVFLKHNRVKTF